MSYNDWNYQRYRTRDLLFNYPLSQNTTTGTIPAIYPWVNSSLTLDVLKNKIYQIFQSEGYTDTQTNFYAKLLKILSAEDNVIVGTLSEFPEIGSTKSLYLDKETGILYFFYTTMSEEEIANLSTIGSAIVGTSVVADSQITYLYVPVKALLIDGTIINGGEVNG